MDNTLYIVVPCYNEEEVLPETSRRLRAKLEQLMAAGKISKKSRVLYVNDGSKDRTWELISRLHEACPLFCGVDLTRNRGHQNALLAGLMTAKDRCDMAISMDADLQDDIDAVDAMVDKFLGGVRHRLRGALLPEEGHLLQALHRRGLLPADERHGGGDGVQPRRLPPHVQAGPGGAGPVQGGQPLPAGHRAHDRLPHRHGGVRAGGAVCRREQIPPEEDAVLRHGGHHLPVGEAHPDASPAWASWSSWCPC